MTNLQLLIALGLTSITAWYILYKGRKKRVFKGILYSQSHIHLMIKDFIPREIFDEPEIFSQAKKHIEKNTIKVIFVDNKAYWVSNNVFYNAEAVNGTVDVSTAEPIDIVNMSKNEVEKMLKILDSLKIGDSDDRGNSRD